MDEQPNPRFKEVLKRTLRWSAQLIAGHVVLQLASALPVAYLLALLQAWISGAPVVLASIPPVTYPILAFLVFAVLFKPAFIEPCLQRRELKKREEKEFARKAKLERIEREAERKEQLKKYAQAIDAAVFELDKLDGLSLRTADRYKVEQRARQRIDYLTPLIKVFSRILGYPRAY